MITVEQTLSKVLACLYSFSLVELAGRKWPLLQLGTPQLHLVPLPPNLGEGLVKVYLLYKWVCPEHDWLSNWNWSGTFGIWELVVVVDLAPWSPTKVRGVYDQFQLSVVPAVWCVLGLLWGERHALLCFCQKLEHCQQGKWCPQFHSKASLFSFGSALGTRYAYCQFIKPIPPKERDKGC